MNPQALRAARRHPLHLLLAALAAVAGNAPPAVAAPAPAESTSLADMNLEDLMDLEVTSVSRKEQPLFRTASAVSVITAEDIRRSGATTIPDLLRLVPEANVAQIDADAWAVSVRGFNSQFSNKLLVMIDGRSVYTPLFSGVFWNVQNVVLEDVERIEVIRGPGATVWGANAVNGVINIITRSAAETQGDLFSVGAGAEQGSFASLRLGRPAGTGRSFRVFGTGFDHSGYEFPKEGFTGRNWEHAQAGFRSDWSGESGLGVTVQGDYYEGRQGQGTRLVEFAPPYETVIQDVAEVSGGNILGRLTRSFSKTADAQLQLYFDRTMRDDAVHGERMSTLDLDLNHRFTWGPRQEIVWGGGFRQNQDGFRSTLIVELLPAERTYRLWSGFIQDEIAVVPDRLSLVLGSKFESNDFSGSEVQPGVRLLWTPAAEHALWGAVSRAVRTPSRAEADVVNRLGSTPGPGGMAVVQTYHGDRGFDSEVLWAHEVGYRVQPSERFSADVTAFYDRYDDLREAVVGAPFLETTPGPPHLVVPIFVQNGSEAETRGLSALGTWSVAAPWKLSGYVSFLDLDIRRESTGADISTQSTDGDAPRFQSHLRSQLTLSRGLELDAMLYHSDNLVRLQVPAYTRLDLRLGWKRGPFDLSLVGQNLQSPKHWEFRNLNAPFNGTQVPRTVFARMSWHI